MDWTNPDYCNSNECYLWGVSIQQLILAGVCFFLAFLARYVMVIIFAIIQYGLHNRKKLLWFENIKLHLFYWTKQLFRAGMVWLGYTQLQFPKNVSEILDHFINIPFIICWLFWTDKLFTCITIILRIELKRKYVGEMQKSNAISSAYEEFFRVIKYIAFLVILVIALGLQKLDIVDFLQNATLFGLALVFSLQPWIRNLVGGMILFFDDKFSVGHTIKILGTEGVVEKITLRTTRIRREDNSVAYIPNSRLLEQPVSNFSIRDKRLVEIRIHLDHSTSSNAIRLLLREIDVVLQTLHPSLASHVLNKIDEIQHRDKRFFAVLDGMYEILIWTYLAELKDKSYAMIQTEILLAIGDLLKKQNIKIAQEIEFSTNNENSNKLKQQPLGEEAINDSYNDDDMDVLMTGTALYLTQATQ